MVLKAGSGSCMEFGVYGICVLSLPFDMTDGGSQQESISKLREVIRDGYTRRRLHLVQLGYGLIGS